jgi:peptide/nickel transport system ATP-binding protein
MTALFQVKDLEIRYHTREGVLTAIRDTSFEVNEAEIVGIVGESGCGKTTVASAVMRLLPPNGEITAGQLLFRGADLRQLDQEAMRAIRGKELAMIFQDPMTSLNPVFSVESQMLDALRAHQEGGEDGSRQALRARAVEMLDRVGIPDAGRQIKEFPHQFSGGMRQRIMIATALLSNPAMLVADEPTSALDVTLEAQIVDLIKGLRDELGTAILYITHDLGVVAQLCDRVLVMYAGSIVEAGETLTIFEEPQHPYTRALLKSHPSRGVRARRLRTIRGRVPSLKELPPGCKFAPRCDYALEACHTTEPQLIQIGGHQVLCHVCHDLIEVEEVPAEEETLGPEGQRVRDESQEVVVQVRELRTHFRDHVPLLGKLLGQRGGTVRAVDRVDITIRRGETLALVGESGSGKTTLGRTVLRLEPPTGGEILIQGQDITHLRQSALRPMRARMAMIFQDPSSSLSPRMKVSSLLLEPFQIHGVPVESQDKVDELLRMVGLSAEQADKYPHQLSGGQARRVGIARALALNPEILVADEPTSGLDVSVAAGILNLLKELRERLDLTYIVISHNLNVISFIADRVAVMYLGKIVELAETEALFERARHPYTEALMSAIPLPDPRLRGKRGRILLTGEIPSPRNPPPGCPFHPRCRYAQARCSGEVPPLAAVEEGGDLAAVAGSDHLAACFFPEKVRVGLFSKSQGDDRV